MSALGSEAIRLLILLNNTIVTTSFSKASPKITEKSFGCSAGLMVEVAATSSMLHMAAANSRISGVYSFLTTEMFEKSLMRL